jgi:DNA-binding response OmpR family regulator
MDVLLVEPNPELRRTFAEALSAAGYSVVTETGWVTALQLARKLTPATVVVDASLDPGAAGRFVNELRQDGMLSGVPIVGIAYRFGAERSILEAGVQCCIQKLPAPDEVVKAVQWAAEVYGETAA